MAIVRDLRFEPLADPNDPDDYRPRSKLAAAVDPGNPGGGLSVLVEEIAGGDRIPLHTHAIDEVLFIDAGNAEVTLGEETQAVSPGAIVFIRAGEPHGTRNTTSEPVRIRAVFPSEEITIHYLERNPAPGTEGDAPQPPVAIDVRKWAAGQPDAIRPLEL